MILLTWKSVISFLVILVLLLCVFTLSAFASTYFPELPVLQVGSTYSDFGFFVGTSNSATVSGDYYLASVDSGSYLCVIGNNLFVFSLDTASVRGGNPSTSPPSSVTSTSIVSRTQFSGKTIYYGNISAPTASQVSNINSQIPRFTTFNEAIDSFATYIDNPVPPPSSGSSLQYSLPPGNAIYIQVASGASYTLRTRMPESVLGSNHYPGNNQVITLVSSLPSGGTAPISPLIPWQQEGALSVLGLSRNASYTGTNASSGYLCIVNPLYYSGTANGPYEFLSNGSIDITIDTQQGFVVYPLDSSLGFTSGLGVSVDTEILDTPFTGSIDSETGEIVWQDSNGGSLAPTTGGGNLVSTSDTIFDFLRNIGDEISTFLKGPIQAIQTVVSAIREFLGSFTQLYMWLPSPVYNLITSALMIALTIGVIKIFV